MMVDRDLALLYGVETRALKQAVKRNIERFPEDFMFELIDSEIDYMVSQSVIPSNVLSSDIAIKIHIDIMRAFVNMRKFISQNASLFTRIESIEKRQISYEIKTDTKIESVLNALEDKNKKPTQGIFYNIGASLKDLGNKVFAFNKMDISSFELLGKLR